MPAVNAPAKVLVTGANGFIAIAACMALVEHGFQVVGAVRTAEKGAYVEELLGADHYSTVIVPDIETDDAYDEAVKGVDAIFHIASPVILNSQSVSSVVGPAVAGTTNLLKSVIKNGSTVKRVVLTSSTAATRHPKDGPYVYTEEDWNDHSVKVIEEQGDNAPGGVIYAASKTIAERAAWKIMEEEQPYFDLVTINPPMVFGPVYQDVKDKKSLNATSASFWEIVTSQDPPPFPNVATFVDVRDVAEAHVLAIEKPGACAQRFITAAGKIDWVEFRDVLQATNLPNVGPGSKQGLVPITNPAYQDGSKASRVLGLKYRSLSEVAVDTYKSIAALPDSV